MLIGKSPERMLSTIQSTRSIMDLKIHILSVAGSYSKESPDFRTELLRKREIFWQVKKLLVEMINHYSNGMAEYTQAIGSQKIKIEK